MLLLDKICMKLRVEVQPPRGEGDVLKMLFVASSRAESIGCIKKEIDSMYLEELWPGKAYHVSWIVNSDGYILCSWLRLCDSLTDGETVRTVLCEGECVKCRGGQPKPNAAKAQDPILGIEAASESTLSREENRDENVREDISQQKEGIQESAEDTATKYLRKVSPETSIPIRRSKTLVNKYNPATQTQESRDKEKGPSRNTGKLAFLETLLNK
jgi:hypothetical protein